MARKLCILLVAGLLSACSNFQFAPQTRGNAVDGEQLKELVPGVSTRADVNSLLGSPTAKGSFDDSTWIYISEVTQPRVGRVQGVNAQNVIEVAFDDRGVLQSIKKYDRKDSKPVSVVARATPSPGSEASFMQQLLGNVGKFNPSPGGLGGSGGGPGGSGSSFGSK